LIRNHDYILYAHYHNIEWEEIIEDKSGIIYDYFKNPIYENTQNLFEKINTYIKAVNNAVILFKLTMIIL